ncbi:hypothetical protein GCM10010218_54120 [Streptomyces mashuensis]|uniref:Uncharacterized protein n=1 Tax=Streptomyces mashuensis TaxID=33904 RepID=A0A919B7G7_9ACTN|nr:SDR family NAD(P)-dependent oxidoreductase [Streptomyces mashuensis]GHF65743.1 hypothetical protein GCM10010218_54120 [Streptomyces mashuensis]
MDVVLNSLSGEAAARSMEVLAPGGRFVELGKVDLYANRRVILRPLAANASFHAVDLVSLLRDDFAGSVSALRTVAHRVRQGQYRPLLHQVYPVQRVDEAFRLLQHSRHIGKVVISLDGPVPVRMNPVLPSIAPDEQYLVIGGLSGLGARVALHLAKRGTRHLALAGRRGMETPGAADLVARLTTLGASVTVDAVDVTDAVAVEQLIRKIDTAEHPLREVIHSVLHLEDDELTRLSDERMRAVLAPKIAGAVLLDRLTRQRNIRLTSYSSMNAWVGSGHQTSYAAANLFLEALARHRRRHGNDALTIAWGTISEAGYVAREGLTETLGQLGMITPDEACAAQDRHHARHTDVVAIGRYDLAHLSAFCPSLATPRFSLIAPSTISGTDYRLTDL